MHERMLDRTVQPTDADMVAWIGQPLAEEWTALRRFLAETYVIDPIYNPGGKKYGWNVQYRAGRRPLCELYPERGSFTALVILGKAELERAMASIETFGSVVRQALTETPRYHDGCWMYIHVTDPLTCRQDVRDIEQLVMIKKKPPKEKAPLS
jgi:hypothetical protein